MFFAALGLHCCPWTLSSCSEQASHCGAFSCGAQALGHECFSRYCTWAQQLWCKGLVALWHVGSSQPRIKLMSPALAVRFLTTGPPGKFTILYISDIMVYVFFFLTSLSVTVSRSTHPCCCKWHYFIAFYT